MAYLSISNMKFITGITEFEVGQSLYLSGMQDQNLNGLHIITAIGDFHMTTSHEVIPNQPSYVEPTPVVGQALTPGLSYSVISLDNSTFRNRVIGCCIECGAMFAHNPSTMTNNIPKCSTCIKPEPKSAPAQKEPFVYIDPDLLWQDNDRY